MPGKSVVRKVKFTPEEMAFEPLPDYSHLKFKRRRRPKHPTNWCELDPEIAAFFKTSTAANNALRMFMEAVPGRAPKRKSA
jgi:hypothetical protein